MALSPRLLRPRASGGGFDPRSIAGLSAWWDFADSAQITLNGGNISQILDKSGTGRTASQGTAAQQPALTASAQNGMSMATFDGSNDHLTYGSDLFTFTGAATVFIVCRDVRVDSGVSNADYAMFLSEYRGSRTSVNVAPALYDTSNARGFRPGFDAWAGQTFDTSSNYGSPTQANPAIIQFYWENWSTHHNDGKALIGVNADSVPITSRGSSALTFSTSASARMIGAGLGGASPQTDNVINGRIGEIAVWTAALNEQQRFAVRNYLGGKWGISTT